MSNGDTDPNAVHHLSYQSTDDRRHNILREFSRSYPVTLQAKATIANFIDTLSTTSFIRRYIRYDDDEATMNITIIHESVSQSVSQSVNSDTRIAILYTH